MISQDNEQHQQSCINYGQLKRLRDCERELVKCCLNNYNQKYL